MPFVPDSDSQTTKLSGFVPDNSDQPGMLASLGAGLGKGFGDVVLGAQNLVGKGISALGGMLPGSGGNTNLTTLVTGQKTPENFIQRAGDWLQNDATQGQANLAQENTPYQQAHSIANGAGNFGGSLVATLPVGGVVGKAVGALADTLPAAEAALRPVATAASSWGTRTGIDTATKAGLAADLAARTVGGGLTGAATTELTDPSHVGEGALLGAVLPPALKVAGTALKSAAVQNLIPAVTQKGKAAQAATDLQNALGVTPGQLGDIVDRLRGAPEYVPGSTPTVSQALTESFPQGESEIPANAWSVESAVSSVPGGAALRQTQQAQDAARKAAINSVAPVDPNGLANAKTDLGGAIQRMVIPEQKAIKKSIGDIYESIDPNGVEQIATPLDKIQAAVDEYLGPGTFGENASAQTAAQTAKAISKPQNQMGSVWNAAPQPPLANWASVNRLRSSINEALEKARINGDNSVAAALGSQKSALDSAIQNPETGLSQSALPIFQSANDAYANMADRFLDGPQGQVFAIKNGVPVKNGADISNLFWGGGIGSESDVKNFRKLIDDNPMLLGQFRSMVTTEGASTATKGADNLTSSYEQWFKNKLPGLRAAFSPEDLQTLQNVANDVRRASNAANQNAVRGSATASNIANAMSAGLIDSPLADIASHKIPILGSLAQKGLSEWIQRGRTQRLADLLSNSGNAADALEGLMNTSPGVLSSLAGKQAVQQGALGTLRNTLMPPNQNP